jgi:hypothetical protein
MGLTGKKGVTYMAQTTLNVRMDEYADTTAAALAESDEIIKSDRRRFKNSAEMLSELKNYADD